MPRIIRSIPALAAFAALAATLLLAGCLARTTGPKPVPDPAPSQNSPAGAVYRFAYCWQNRDTDRYSRLFTQDYILTPAVGDSSANSAPHPWDRDAELLATSHMFVGDSTHTPPAKITLAFDRTLVPLSDPRPAHANRWHHFIRTHVDLNLIQDAGGGSTGTKQVQGLAAFYLVRGDSAQIPEALAAKGVKPDSTRWYIERMEDETLPSGAGLHALPAKNTTWYSVLASYL